MISRTTFCSAQPETMQKARMGPIPETSVRVPLTPCIDLQDRKAILGIVEGHALH